LKGSSDPKDQMPGCANYDHHYGGCLFENFGGACAVEIGKRCGYFERAVLPTSAETGQREHIYGLYEQTVGVIIDTAKTRKRTGDARPCPDCGSPLRTRQRYCDTCSTRRQREQNRRYSRNRRRSLSHSGELTENQASQMP